MATRKDQLDAFVFARRRMVANLVAPSPTGSDEGAPRPVKTFFTSAILSAIAVAGVAVLGVFKPSAPSGWENGLAVDSSSGAAYVYSAKEKVLHPMLNITSARLLLGQNFKKFDVPDNVINGPNMTIGAPFGIPGAPPDVPPASSVDLNTWTLCLQSKSNANQTLDGGKTLLGVGYSNAGMSPVNQSTGFVVHDASRNYLIAENHAYPVQDNRVLRALIGASVDPGVTVGPWVSSTWLKVFQPGNPLQFPTLDGIGDRLTVGNQPGEFVGQYGTLSTPNGPVGYIETASGLIEVNYFVYSLYIANPDVSRFPNPMNLNIAQVNDAGAKAGSLGSTGPDWPKNLVTVLDSDGVHGGFGVFCATYSGTFDGSVPHLNLYYGATPPQPLGSGTGVAQNGSGSSLADAVYVKPGHAALARDVSNGDSLNVGPQYLVTDTGTRYLMQNGTSKDENGQSKPIDVYKQLQYDNVKPHPVPDSWLKLIQIGANLDPTAAGQTPTITGQ
jgi:type VII secretion protein EccB